MPLAAAGAGLIIAADLAAGGGAGYETRDAVVFLAAFPALPVMGLLLATRQRSNPIGWLFLVAAVAMAASAFSHGYGDYGIYARPGRLPATAAVVWLGWLGWVGFGLLARLLWPSPWSEWRHRWWFAFVGATPPRAVRSDGWGGAPGSW